MNKKCYGCISGNNLIVTTEPPTDQQTNHLEVDYEIVAWSQWSWYLNKQIHESVWANTLVPTTSLFCRIRPWNWPGDKRPNAAGRSVRMSTLNGNPGGEYVHVFYGD